MPLLACGLSQSCRGGGRGERREGGRGGKEREGEEKGEGKGEGKSRKEGEGFMALKILVCTH